MQLTIVICTHNRANLLVKTLNSINKATRSANIEVEILAVANACTDNTTHILDSYRANISKKDWLKLNEGVKATLEGKSRDIISYTMLKNDGTEFPAEATSSTIKDKDGNVLKQFEAGERGYISEKDIEQMLAKTKEVDEGILTFRERMPPPGIAIIELKD